MRESVVVVIREVAEATSKLLPDKIYISLVYFKHFKKFPDLENPKTYNEKLQWLKLYDRNEAYVQMVDKLLVKEYISEMLGKQYVIPTLKVWGSAKDITLKGLPGKFVLKCNHDSKSCILCNDTTEFDLNNARAFLNKRLRKNGYWYGREWVYKNINSCVFAEELLESPDGDLKDFKVMCFNGKAKLVEVHSNRFTEGHTQDFYDTSWSLLDITQGAHNTTPIQPPDTLEEMITLSEKLAAGIRHVRIDWYSTEGKLYFGEITFFDGSGFVPFDNPEHDLLLGSWIDLK